MAGVRQFDESAVADRMMWTFWERGFEGTSIDDLVAATGLKRGSLYNAFGDKEAMFCLAVARYAEGVAAPQTAALDDPDPRQGVERYLAAHLERMADPFCPAGCLSTAAGLELGGRPGRLGQQVARGAAAAEATIATALDRWRGAGRLAPTADVTALARFLLALVRGMAAVHKATGDLAAARDAAGVGLAVLDRWLTAPRAPAVRPPIPSPSGDPA